MSSGEDGASIWTSSSSAAQIKALSGVEERLAHLLQLASELMTALAPVLDPSGKSKKTMEDRREEIKVKGNEYFATLNAIQTVIRLAIRRIRIERMPLRPLLSPQSVSIAGANAEVGVPAHARPPSDQEALRDKTLSLPLMRIERDVWRDLKELIKSDSLRALLQDVMTSGEIRSEDEEMLL
ncbi:uncharacterized protein L969DRAFT_51566 [Mixia osmundae IAM 14324]|uniref:Mediator of RNA polymerase II transcription subunit 11 n=1 Tax=Mixia osmundae (strain CBS 9802 / IAM 14324 / JCM 22182 / KY 12970) TaxID=764103 RepID=G7DX41_MIXOS|nr:uncharacterized protein L969DRAFT_51566 [Mixia osmundae IAM 14324]KEI38054.1 hypothetical protein L969DRAFT_51566 [Mixia osmundae IAM 14324]GAA95138.1 hypothetical protein E5Q_01793 [Mixia osmundae IAM 14324]